MINPFAVQTPEDISAKDAHDLFVDVFTDFYQVPNQGHTFLNGPRGSGKSMMFRYMLPDCQSIKENKQYEELAYFSFYIPIKKTDLNIIDLKRLESNAQNLFNEHLLVTYISEIIFDNISELLKLQKTDEKKLAIQFKSFYENDLSHLLNSSGFLNESYNIEDNDSLTVIIDKIKSIFIHINKASKHYIKRITFNKDVYYEGSILGYLDFLYPMLVALKNIDFFPSERPFFLLIDDADNLNLTQTKILNSWVSYRTSAKVSLKISTQTHYKTYRALNNETIDTPHDYSEVNIATIYTSSKNKFYKRVKDIVEKRIKIFLKTDINAEDFFPNNEKQEEEILKISSDIRKNFKEEGKGYTASDDVKRYARPNYIKNLKSKRSGSTYSYAGFEQLVSISSGIVRYFLEAASLMYGEVLSNQTVITEIPHSIQNRVIQNYSDKFLFDEFENIFKEKQNADDNKILKEEKLSKPDMLLNLISGLGGMFHIILISNASERRVFSIAFTNKPNNELEDVLKLGVRYGYFHLSSIGNKQGTGRTKLYILSRRLAPHFKLDPTSFAGYKFVDRDLVTISLTNEKLFIRKVKEKIDFLGEKYDVQQLKIEWGDYDDNAF
jgi:hypothetical protein